MFKIPSYSYSQDSGGDCSWKNINPSLLWSSSQAMATLSDSGAGPYSMLLKISLTLGLVTFTLAIASPAAREQWLIFCSVKTNNLLDDDTQYNEDEGC